MYVLQHARRPARAWTAVPGRRVSAEWPTRGAHQPSALGAPVQLGCRHRGPGDHAERSAGDHCRRHACVVRFRICLRAGHTRRHLVAISDRRVSRYVGKHTGDRRQAQAGRHHSIRAGRARYGDTGSAAGAARARAVLWRWHQAAERTRQRKASPRADAAVLCRWRGAPDRLRQPVEPLPRARGVTAAGDRRAYRARREPVAADPPASDGKRGALVVRCRLGIAVCRGRNSRSDRSCAASTCPCSRPCMSTAWRWRSPPASRC